MKMSKLPPASARYLGYGKAAVVLSSDMEKIGTGVFWTGDMIVSLNLRGKLNLR